MTTTTITTDANYDETLELAEGLLAERLPLEDAPEGEAEKARADALNDAWVDGITVAEWVDAAARTLSGAELVRQAVDASGLSARAFAYEVMAGRDERTVRRWIAGEVPVPAQTRQWLTEWLAAREQ